MTAQDSLAGINLFTDALGERQLGCACCSPKTMLLPWTPLWMWMCVFYVIAFCVYVCGLYVFCLWCLCFFFKYVFVYICVCVFILVCMYFAFVYLSICACVCLCVYLCVFLHTFIRIHTTCVYLCIYICFLVSMYLCTYLHICIFVCMHLCVQVCFSAGWITRSRASGAMLWRCNVPTATDNGGRGGCVLPGRDTGGFGVLRLRWDTRAPCLLTGFTLTHQGCNSVTWQVEPLPEINMREMFWHVMFKKKKVKFGWDHFKNFLQKEWSQGGWERIPWRGDARKRTRIIYAYRTVHF